MAKNAGKNAVGFIIGMESDTMNKFWSGYQQGVYSIDPEMKILYTNIDSFDSEEEYWEYQFTVYQKNLPIQKYVQALQLEFQNSLATTYSAAETNDSASNYTELWNDYYDSYKQDLVEQENYSLNNNILQ